MNPLMPILKRKLVKYWLKIEFKYSSQIRVVDLTDPAVEAAAVKIQTAFKKKGSKFGK